MASGEQQRTIHLMLPAKSEKSGTHWTNDMWGTEARHHVLLKGMYGTIAVAWEYRIYSF